MFWTQYSFIVTILISMTIFLSEKKSEAAKASEHTYLDHVICRHSPVYTQNCTCKLNFITRLQKSFSSNCTIKKKIDHAVGHTQLFHKFRSGYQLFLIDRMINVCKYMKGKSTSAIIDIVLPTFKKHFVSDANQTLGCPYQGRFNIVNLPINGALLNNMFLPVGEYYVNLTVFAYEKDLVWNGKFYFVIPEGKTIEDDRMGR